MATDSPEDHLDEHTLVNLNQKLFHNAAARVRPEQRKGRSALKACVRLSQPAQCPFPASIDRLCRRENANGSQDAIRFFDRQLLAARTTVLKRS